MSEKITMADTHRAHDGSVQLPFARPDLVRELAGPHEAHLAIIEKALEVSLAAPGGMVTITGEDDHRIQASHVLSRLYRQLEAGETVGEAEVRAALRDLREGRSDQDEHAVIRVNQRSFRARTAAQARYVQLLNDIDYGLLFGVGPAGTGKTFLAVAQGAKLLANRAIERLVVTRPAVEAGERLGFLPGDLEEKVDPYMLPIWDALRETLGARTAEQKREAGKIEVAPLAFMRGRTLTNAFVIVDEAQNATTAQMQMVLTRIGENTRMVVTGDPSQVDLPNHQRSGLEHALDLLKNVDGVGHVRFAQRDVVRHALVGRIVAAYEADRARQERSAR